MPIKLIIADFDGTLADSMACWAALPAQCLEKHRIEPPAELDALIRSRSMRELARLFAERWPALGSPEAVYQDWMDTMGENYLSRVALKPGIPDLLRALRAEGLPVSLLSATAHPLLDPAAAHLGLSPLLDSIFTEGDAGASKRGPEPYELCLRHYGLPPEEALLLEDSCPNIRSGAALGLHCCGIYDPVMAGSWEELKAAAELSLTDTRDWPRILDYIHSVL